MEDTQEKLNLNLLAANKDGELVIVHREDEAKVVHYETAVKLNGTIAAPRKFLEERGSINGEAQQDIKRSHVLYSYRGLYIKFNGIENHPINYSVDGVLLQNPKLKELALNTRTKFTSKELSHHLRFNRFFFAERDENLTLVGNLQSYKAKIETEIQKEGDERVGNKRDLYDVKVDGKPLGFNLLMPIFIGQPPVKFHVEIMVDIRDREVSFWLDSPELTELLEQKAKEIIDKELEFFAGKGYVLIEQ